MDGGHQLHQRRDLLDDVLGLSGFEVALLSLVEFSFGDLGFLIVLGFLVILGNILIVHPIGLSINIFMRGFDKQSNQSIS